MNYEGAWIPFDGDRARFRLAVEKILRERFGDSSGKLRVDENGPHWNGSQRLEGLSYSHSGEWGLVVWSELCAVGVDIEREDRALKKNYLALAQRFFVESEVRELEKVSVFDGQAAFLELWMKKEAYSKLCRKHLVEFINIDVGGKAVFELVAKTRVGYRAVVALG